MLERLTRASQAMRQRRPVALSPVGALKRVAASLLAVVAVLGSSAVASNARSHREAGSSLVCGLDDRRALWPVSTRTGARKQLVPPAAVSLTVCRYNGMNAISGVPQFGLRGVGVTADHATIARLTDQLDALRAVRGSFNCPMDDGSQDVAYFSYPSGPSVVVTVGTNGCNSISNGHIRRLGLGRPVVAQLSAIAKPITTFKWATVTGRIRLCGGPAPGRCWTDGSMVDRVVADNSAGLWVGMAQVSGGRFHMQIATPGTYTFQAMGKGKQLNTVITRSPATVRAGATTAVVLTIPVP